MKELSKREKEVIELLCKGYKDKEIAGELFISQRTIQTYIERISYKLKALNRLSAVANYVELKYKKENTI